MIEVRITGHILVSASLLCVYELSGGNVERNGLWLTRSWKKDKVSAILSKNGTYSDAIPLEVSGVVRRVWWIEHSRGRR